MESTTPNSTFLVSTKPYDSWIPEGFVVVVGPDNEQYIVPEYAVPELEKEYESKKMKKILGAFQAKGTVSIFCIFG